MKKIIKKLQKGYTPEQVSRKTGIPLEGVLYVQNILKTQTAFTHTGPVETEVTIDGKEV